MAANISLNQFAPNTPVAGLYVYQANLPQLHNVIVSSSQDEDSPLIAGAVLTLDTDSTNTNAPTVKQASVTDAIFGVLVYNPVQTLYTAGDRIAAARPNDIIWMPAAGVTPALK